MCRCLALVHISSSVQVEYLILLAGTICITVFFLIKDNTTVSKGPDSAKIDKLTAGSGDVKGTKVTDGASALHFDVR